MCIRLLGMGSAGYGGANPGYGGIAGAAYGNPGVPNVGYGTGPHGSPRNAPWGGSSGGTPGSTPGAAAVILMILVASKTSLFDKNSQLMLYGAGSYGNLARCIHAVGLIILVACTIYF